MIEVDISRAHSNVANSVTLPTNVTGNIKKEILKNDFLVDLAKDEINF